MEQAKDWVFLSLRSNGLKAWRHEAVGFPALGLTVHWGDAD